MISPESQKTLHWLGMTMHQLVILLGAAFIGATVRALKDILDRYLEKDPKKKKEHPSNHAITALWFLCFLVGVSVGFTVFQSNPSRFIAATLIGSFFAANLIDWSLKNFPRIAKAMWKMITKTDLPKD